ncbi:uncharacterized protein LOC112494971 [Cephus cinctus]|uniref:Uncharacterized protein LOC112494971 n=1 Tax=Cephus cinctus TaxID=211228 RepID=A0AAJ7RPX4_CEPCN|nr:uncharacterized protein LOC112494971 [Cephus cinctus]
MDASLVPVAEDRTSEAKTSLSLSYSFTANQKNPSKIINNAVINNQSAISHLDNDTSILNVLNQSQDKYSNTNKLDSQKDHLQEEDSSVMANSSKKSDEYSLQVNKETSKLIPNSIWSTDKDNRTVIRNCSRRSTSSPQLGSKTVSRSKVYRKASLKSSSDKLTPSTNYPYSPVSGISPETRITTISNHSKITALEERNIMMKTCQGKKTESSREKNNDAPNDTKLKWNMENVHITCNPLSNPYPYSTPCQKSTCPPVTESQEEEPKSHSCGSFLPILSLIPQTVVSFQYLSPKMKFSWWRNKIS